MRISRLELDGIGPFDMAVFEFQPSDPDSSGELVLFEGPNGSGKTTLMLSIALTLLKSSKRMLFSRFPENNDLLRLPPFLLEKRAHKGGSIKILITDGNSDIEWGYVSPHWEQIQLKDSALPIHSISNKSEAYINALRGRGSTQWAVYSFASHQKTPVMAVRGPAPIQEGYLKRTLFFGSEPPSGPGEDLRDAPPFGQLLSNFDYERSRAIAYGTKSSSESQRTKFDETASSYEDALQRMQDALTEVMDREVRFDFRLGEPAPRVLFDDKEIPLELLGEGLRSTFSWLSDLLIQLLLTPWTDKTRSPLDQDFWLLLDEVDQSLHPQMQLRLMPALRKLFKNARIYATTHSPFVVASAGRGQVFTISPDRKSHRVSGPQRTVKLEPGQTLERIVSEVFGSPSLFIDGETRAHLAEHERLVSALRKGQDIDWDRFLQARTWLMDRTEEVRAVVAMREVHVQKLIEPRLREASA